MKRPTKDAKRERLNEERETAGLRLDILSDGIAEALKRSEGAWGAERVRRVIAFANQELLPAADRAEAANDAYRPYWSRRRHIHRPPRATRKSKPSPTLRPKHKKGAS